MREDDDEDEVHDTGEEASDSSVGGGHWYAGYRSPLPASIEEEELETRDRTMSVATDDGVAALASLSRNAAR